MIESGLARILRELLAVGEGFEVASNGRAV
jgi:hypothetical protein